MEPSSLHYFPLTWPFYAGLFLLFTALLALLVAAWGHSSAPICRTSARSKVWARQLLRLAVPGLSTAFS
jgi:hypothetical protein